MTLETDHLVTLHMRIGGNGPQALHHMPDAPGPAWAMRRTPVAVRRR
ncbi:MAG: hypothetical protein JNK75_10370 [Betaproteobacteria bacterium]|nr:hypothetical protein [Betaproteobacteria bacterium]